MRPRVTLITLGVDDLESAVRFYRATHLPKLLSGEIRVKDAEKMAGAVL